MAAPGILDVGRIAAEGGEFGARGPVRQVVRQERIQRTEFLRGQPQRAYRQRAIASSRADIGVANRRSYSIAS